MTIHRKNPYGPIDPEALKAFEATLPAPLPADLRAFLLESNGDEFIDAPEITEVPGGTLLSDVFGLHEGPSYLRLDRMHADMAPLVGRGLLVFAANPFGNYFGLALIGTDRENVYFIDHEGFGSGGPRVAGSFRELALGAGGVEVEPHAEPEDIESAILERNREVLDRLIAAGESARGHVHRALASSDNGILKRVLEAGGDPDERGAIHGSETPLFVAARQGRADMAALLLKHGADPNAKCSVGGTALEMAEPYPEVLRLLALAGGKPTKPSLAQAIRYLLGR